MRVVGNREREEGETKYRAHEILSEFALASFRASRARPGIQEGSGAARAICPWMPACTGMTTLIFSVVELDAYLLRIVLTNGADANTPDTAFHAMIELFEDERIVLRDAALLKICPMATCEMRPLVRELLSRDDYAPTHSFA